MTLQNQLRVSLILEELRKDNPETVAALETQLRAMISHMSTRIVELEMKLKLARMDHGS